MLILVRKRKGQTHNCTNSDLLELCKKIKCQDRLNRVVAYLSRTIKQESNKSAQSETESKGKSSHHTPDNEPSRVLLNPVKPKNNDGAKRLQKICGPGTKIATKMSRIAKQRIEKAVKVKEERSKDF